MRPARRKLLLRCAGFLLLPPLLLTGLLTFGAVNPMGLVFLTSFEVVNSTAEDLFISPIGAVDLDGHRWRLPYSAIRHLYLMTDPEAEFRIAADSTRTFTYDWDDIQFSEILCRTADGPFRIFPTGLHPTEGQFRRPRQTKFEITDVDSLQPAAELHLEALRDVGVGVWPMYLLAAIGCLSPLCFWLARRIPSTVGGERGVTAIPVP